MSAEHLQHQRDNEPDRDCRECNPSGKDSYVALCPECGRLTDSPYADMCSTCIANMIASMRDTA